MATRSLERIRMEMNQETRRLAQAYLYGTADERERCRQVVERLAAEEEAVRQRWLGVSVGADVLAAG